MGIVCPPAPDLLLPQLLDCGGGNCYLASLLLNIPFSTAVLRHREDRCSCV